MSAPVSFSARDLPPRLTTSEVCAVGRISRRTFSRRRKDGTYQIQPCDHGAEDLYDRDTVLRVFGMMQDAAPAKQEPGA